MCTSIDLWVKRSVLAAMEIAVFLNCRLLKSVKLVAEPAKLPPDGYAGVGCAGVGCAPRTSEPGIASVSFPFFIITSPATRV